jgi:glycosyltransferase involved in cell wall biosynthesis
LTAEADLVVVEQASRLLLNYPLLLRGRFSGQRVAIWGHGRNLNPASVSLLGERLKKRLVVSADWWFAYTQATAELFEQNGASTDRITVLQNAIDTRALVEARREVTGQQIASTRTELGLIPESNVAIVVGSVYAEKTPDYLVQAVDCIRQMCSDFHVIIVGNGPLYHTYVDASRSRPWMHLVGTRTGIDLAKYAAVSSIMLNPGLVGLAVLDSFALGLPMVTRELPNHSPEFHYLDHGRNGLVLPSGVHAQQYARAAADLFGDPEMLRLFRDTLVDLADEYTISAMAERFTLGIHSALAVGRAASL